MRICVFGDSTSWGAWDEELCGWVNRLRIHIPAKYSYENEIYNLGISGETTRYLLNRFAVEAKARRPDVILFAIGENDAGYTNSEDNPNVSLEQFKLNILKLIKLAKKFTNKIAFLGFLKFDDSRTQPLPWNASSFHTNARTKKYNDVLKEICEENKINFIEMYDLLSIKNYEESDGIHPDATGHELIFKRMADFLVKNNWIIKE